GLCTVGLSAAPVVEEHAADGTVRDAVDLVPAEYGPAEPLVGSESCSAARHWWSPPGPVSSPRPPYPRCVRAVGAGRGWLEGVGQAPVRCASPIDVEGVAVVEPVGDAGGAPVVPHE